MIRDWLTPDKIKVINSIDSWENAVRVNWLKSLAISKSYTDC